jgi:hypothetical protein
MTDTGFVRLTNGSRLQGRQMRRGVRGDIIKRIVELVKNSDDAYDRLELDDTKTSGIIEIGFDSLKSGKGYSPKGFFVRDFGAGMSTDKMKSAYLGAVHGDDTSDETRNGAIGVGGKDAFVDMEDCYVLSVHNGILTVVNLVSDQYGQTSTRILTGSDSESPLKFANVLLKKGKLEEISLSKNQTIALFKVPDRMPGARSDKIAEQLTQFYTLRWILESDIRTIKLTDLVNCDTRILRHTPIQGDPLKSKTIEIPFKKIPYKVEIEIRRCDDDLKHHTEYGYGILIQDHRGAIVDNQMYGYEADSAASKLFGRVIFHEWKKCYRESSGEILTDNREGLDPKHTVNQILRTHILTMLKPIIDAEREKQGDSPKLDKTLNKNINKAMNLLNKLINKKPSIALPTPPTGPPANGIEFESEQYTFTPLKPKIVRLAINPGMIPTDSTIALSVIGDGIDIVPDSTIVTPSSYDTNNDGVIDSNDEIPFLEIEVTGKDLKTNPTVTTLKAVYGDYEAETTINIVFETVLKQPTNGFSFVPTKVSIVPKKPRKIQLLIDVNQVAIGTSIVLTCNDDRIEFKPKTLTVSGPPNIGVYLTEEIITISGEKVGIKAKLTAETESKTSLQMSQTFTDTRTSICEIQVKEKEPPKTFFKDYELDKKGDKRVRSRFKQDEGIIYIHVNSPILKYSFGETQQHLHDKKPDALILLADTIVDRMTYEYAKHQVDTGEYDVLDDETTAIETLQGDLEYELGLSLLQTIIHGAAKRENNY